ncbi:MAG: hypothetical protein IKN38_04430, partial [Clostridia bacterium]|nr:hypothetical protein [Clostridia bacterium]
MKFSFSTNHWDGYTIFDFFSFAADYDYSGIEIHSASELDDADLSLVYGKQRDTNINICCINLTSDISKSENFDAASRELSLCFDIAKKLDSPYIRLKCSGDVGDKNAVECASLFVKKHLSSAQARGVELLVESMGVFSDTSALKDFLDSFASDSLGALWDFYYPYSVCKETPDLSIKNLGAYVR